jgi:hypothetical protein
VPPSRDEMIRPGFRRRIGRAWIVGRLLGEQPLVAERAVYLVGRDIVKAECRLGLVSQPQPVGVSVANIV